MMTKTEYKRRERVCKKLGLKTPGQRKPTADKVEAYIKEYGVPKLLTKQLAFQLGITPKALRGAMRRRNAKTMHTQ